MDLKDIKTVQDLINENEVEEEDTSVSDKASEIVAQALAEGFEVGHEVAIRLSKAALVLHQKWLRDGMEMDLDSEELKAQFAILSRDVTLLQVAINNLEEVS